ncbi:hypothetical protein GGS24DRAFT_511301 [Hypoxylon argillaceum]|nr:hypothetical protein GGS24DRAFT_511301 [Hypoxylon argillaceum]
MAALLATQVNQAGEAGQKINNQFHPYPRLPTELKLKIWTHVLEDMAFRGAHRFRLFQDNNGQLLTAPFRDRKDDASAWRERRTISHIDHYSFAAVRIIERRGGNGVIMHKDVDNSRTARREENWVTARVSQDDLVTFKFNYGQSRAEVALLQPSLHQNKFAGITHLGIEESIFQLGHWRGWQYEPFQCYCNKPHKNRRYCNDSMIQFLRCFKDLKEFYLISTNNDCQLEHRHYRAILPIGLLTPSISRASEYHKVDKFSHHQTIAYENGLKQFHNRGGTYCEVRQGDLLGPLDGYAWTPIASLAQAWNSYQQEAGQQGLAYQHVKFGVLLWTDLRGVTVKATGRLLRSFEPWE